MTNESSRDAEIYIVYNIYIYVYNVGKFLSARPRQTYNFADSYSYRHNFGNCRADIRRFTSDERIIDPGDRRRRTVRTVYVV